MKNLIKIILIVILCSGNCILSQLTEQWHAAYNGPGNDVDIPLNIATDESGNVYTAGGSKGTGPNVYDIALIKYNSSGIQQWVARYNGLPKALIIRNDEIFIGGSSGLGSGPPVILRYNIDGNLISVYNVSGNGIINDLIKDNQGNIYACGYHLDSLILIKINLNGDVVWHKNFIYPQTIYNLGYSMKINDFGQIYVLGRVNTNQNINALIVKFDANGNLIWSRTFNSIYNSFEHMEDITLLNDGSICIAGAITDSNKALLVKYSAQGNLLWTYISDQNSFYRKIDIDEFDNIYVGTDIYNNNVTSPGIIKFNKNGTILWSRYHYSANYESIYDLEIKNCSNIYFSYMSLSTVNMNYSGISKYNSNGSLSWNYQQESQVWNTTQGSAEHFLAIGDNNTLYAATTGIINPQLADFHTYKYTEQYHSVSGQATYKDNNEPVPAGGHVLAFYYDNSTSSIVKVDSAAIQQNGMYSFTKLPQDSLDLMFYQNDDLLQYVPTYYVSTTDWREATKIYPNQNLTNINCQVYRINNQVNPFTISGQVLCNTGEGTIVPLNDAVIYAKIGEEYKNFGFTSANGTYTVTKLPAGTYQLTAMRYGFAPIYMNITITTNSLQNVSFIFGNPIGISQNTGIVPKDYSISQNFPNPFNPVTTIKFGLPKAGNVKLVIFDVLGRNVKTLLDNNMKEGSYSVNWDASGFPSGIYFYRIESRDFIETKKMVLIK